MAVEFVIGLYHSRGIAEDAVNRLRTEGVPDPHVALRMLRETTEVPPAVDAELSALTVDPMIWGNVRENYVDYISNGETIVMVRTETDLEAEVAMDVLRMFEPMVVELLDAQRAPRSRSDASSVVE
ncbi:MAG TPA: hypothetical protein VGG57_07015 [Stellaceae bacterium]|jgi:hypothetical protein